MRSVILDNIRQIRYRIETAARKARRDPESVTLVVVTKYAPLDEVRQVCESGLVDFVAENRVQDADSKKRALGEAAGRVKWRLIGHLQTNKAKKAAQIFDAVDSVDSLKVAAALDAAGRKLPVLVQVKLTGRETQSGVPPDELDGLLEGLKQYKNLEPNGLMAIAPQAEDPEQTRPHFRRMRALFERHFAGKPGAQLSMGMSGDFETAVEEGSTMVRLGRIVFSEQQSATARGEFRAGRAGDNTRKGGSE